MFTKVTICLLASAVFMQSQVKAVDPPPTTASNANCTTTVYLYLDISGSLSPNQKTEIEKVVNRAISPDGDNPVPVERETFIVPFAGKVGNPKRITEIDVTSEISKLYDDVNSDKYSDLNRRQSDIIDVLGDMKKRIEAGLNGVHPIFVVASDFLHDITDRDDDEARGYDFKDWTDRSPRILGRLASYFSPPSDSNKSFPILLLFPVSRGDERPDIRSQVLRDLHRLVPYNDQIYPIHGEATDDPKILSFIRPIAISASRGEQALHVTLENTKKCDKVPDLRLEVKGKLSNLPLSLVNRGSSECLFGKGVVRCEFDVSLSDLQPPDQGIGIAIKRLKDKDGNGESVQAESFDTREYFRIDSINAHFGSFNRILNAAVSGQYVLWHSSPRVSLSLRDHGKGLGKPQSIGTFSPFKTLEPQHFSLPSVELQVEGGRKDLAELCMSGRGEQFFIKAHAYDGEGNSLDHLVIPQEPIQVHVIPHDGQSDLLRDFVEHGSFPALFTLLTILVMLARHRETGLAHIHEILGVTGFWLTLFAILRRMDWSASFLDSFFVGDLARWMAFLVALALSAVGAAMQVQGVLSPARGEAEIGLEIALEEMASESAGDNHGRYSERRRRRYGYGRWLLIVVLPLGFGFALLKTEPVIDCAFIARAEWPVDLPTEPLAAPVPAKGNSK